MSEETIEVWALLLLKLAERRRQEPPKDEKGVADESR